MDSVESTISLINSIGVFGEVLQIVGARGRRKGQG